VEEVEEDLEVFNEAEDCDNADADVEMTDDKTSASTPLPVGKAKTDISSATTKKKKKKSKKAKLLLTGGGGASLNDSQVLPPQPEVHTVNPTPESSSSTKPNNKKRAFPPSETPTGDSEDPASVSVSAAVSTPQNNKKRKRNKKNPTTAGVEPDGITSQSRPRSRDVSVASTPQVVTLPLPGVETNAAVAGVVEKRKKKPNRKKKGTTVQPAAAEAGAQS